MEPLLSSSELEVPRLLRDLAFLHFAMAYGTDEELTDEERQRVTEKLSARYPDLKRATVQTATMNAMARFADAEDAMGEAVRLGERLKRELPPPARRLLHEDLAHIAEADGIVLESEQDLLDTLADTWELEGA